MAKDLDLSSQGRPHSRSKRRNSAPGAGGHTSHRKADLLERARELDSLRDLELVEEGDELPTPDVRMRPLKEGASNKSIVGTVENDGGGESIIASTVPKLVSSRSAAASQGRNYPRAKRQTSAPAGR